MPVVDVVNLDGKKVGQVELADAIFSAKVNQHLLHKASRWHLRELRSGTHKLTSRYLGPFRVLGTVNDNAVTLDAIAQLRNAGNRHGGMATNRQLAV